MMEVEWVTARVKELGKARGVHMADNHERDAIAGAVIEYSKSRATKVDWLRAAQVLTLSAAIPDRDARHCVKEIAERLSHEDVRFDNPQHHSSEWSRIGALVVFEHALENREVVAAEALVLMSEMLAGSDAGGFHDALQKVVGTACQLLSSRDNFAKDPWAGLTGAAQTKRTKEVVNQLRLETDALWWARSLYSPYKRKPYREVPPEWRLQLMALELKQATFSSTSETLTHLFVETTRGLEDQATLQSQLTWEEWVARRMKTSINGRNDFRTIVEQDPTGFVLATVEFGAGSAGRATDECVEWPTFARQLYRELLVSSWLGA